MEPPRSSGAPTGKTAKGWLAALLTLTGVGLASAQPPQVARLELDPEPVAAGRALHLTGLIAGDLSGYTATVNFTRSPNIRVDRCLRRCPTEEDLELVPTGEGASFKARHVYPAPGQYLIEVNLRGEAGSVARLHEVIVVPPKDGP